MEDVRGNLIGMIFQDPLTSLNPTMTHRRPDRGVGPAAPGRVEGGRARAGGRGARPGRHAAARRAGVAVPAPAVGRHAAAGDDRDGARQRAEAAHRGRADDRARRDHPEADPGADRLAAAAAGDVGDPGHPRPRRDRRHGRPGRGDVRGADRRDRHHRGALRQPPPSVHGGAVRGAAGAGRRRGRGRSGRRAGRPAALQHSRPAPGPYRAAAWVQVRGQVPLCAGGMQANGAAANGRGRLACVPLLLSGRAGRRSWRAGSRS